MNKMIFTTDAGLEVHYEPASALQIEMSEQGIRKAYKERGASIEPPTYEVETVGGGTQVFQHDKDTIKTDEQKAAWEKYLVDSAEMEIEIINTRNAILMDAILVDLPADGAWEARQKKRYIQIPDDPDEKRSHYIQTEVLKTVNDAYGITEKIMIATLSGAVPEAAIEAASATFRNSKSAFEEPVSTAGEPTAETSGEVAAQ